MILDDTKFQEIDQHRKALELIALLMDRQLLVSYNGNGDSVDRIIESSPSYTKLIEDSKVYSSINYTKGVGIKKDG